MLIVFFAFFSTSIWDIDFWWHLASGRHILTDGSIPDSDPFGMYEDSSSLRAQTVLKASWLGQCLLYLVHRFSGEDGIIALKAVVLTFCLLILFLRARLQKVPAIFALLMVFLAGMTLLQFTGARPQLFSFLLASLSFLCVDAYRAGHGQKMLLYLLPVMWIWANCHGAFALGASLLGLTAVGLFAEGRLDRDADIKSAVYLIIGMAIVVTLMTPNGVNTYAFILDFASSPYKGVNTEYLSPWLALTEFGNPFGWYWTVLVLTCVSAVKLAGRPTIVEFSLSLALLVISLDAVRYIPFFLLIAGPYTARGLGAWMQGVALPNHAIYGASIVLAAALLILGGYRHAIFQRGVDEHRYPVKAVELAVDNALTGRVFNHLNWGGYLLWYRFPAMRPFIDGRVLDDARLESYRHMLWATPFGIDAFEKEAFDFVLIPYGNPVTGEPYTLNRYLLSNPAWRSIYADELGMVFARRPQQRVE